MKTNLIFTIFITSLIFPPLILAQKESTASPKISQDIIEKVKNRLEKTSEIEVQETPKVQWYGQFGVISSINPSGITLTNNGENLEIRISPETELNFFAKGSGNKKITQDKIEVDWFAVAMGQEITNNKNLVAKRISFSAKPETSTSKKTLIGKISEIDEDSLTISNENQKTALKIPTEYSLKIKGLNKNPKLENIAVADKIIAIITTTKDEEGETNSISAIYIIPGLNNPLSKDNQIKPEEASNSAQATKSAEKKN